MLKIAIQMDPIAAIDIDGDTSFALGLEAQARGHALYYYTPDALSLLGGVPSARVQALELKDRADAFFSLGAEEIRALRDFDVILMRQDPPFDMNYIAATHFLEAVHPETLVVNDPVSVRNAPEKILVTQFPELVPPTLITRDISALRAFRGEYKDIILKPLFGNGGAGIFHVTEADENFEALLEMFLTNSREPIIAQDYLPAVRDGDKRVMLVEGEAVGALNRIPSPGDARSNLHIGGAPELINLSPRDYEIAERIGPILRDRGVVFAGIDVIGGLLTEINVTSPTGIRTISALGGEDIAGKIWDAIEARLKMRRSKR